MLALAGFAAGLGVTPALAQPNGRLLVAVDFGIFSGQNAAAHVRIFSGASGGAWSPAAGEFDVIASSGGWHAASAGMFQMGDGSVRSISYNLPPAPAGAAPKPVEVWDGTLRSSSSAAGLVRVEARPTAMSVYPTPSAGPVAVTPTGSVAYILDNPVAFGPALAAPGDGTSMHSGPTGLVAAATGPDPILIGLLLPAVQKVRVGTPQAPTDFAVEFQRPTAGDDMPTEQVSLAYTRATSNAYHVRVDTQAAAGDDNCVILPSGLLVCLLDHFALTGGFVAERLPNTHAFEHGIDPATGNLRTITTLAWDQPAQVAIGHFSGPIVRLRFAVVNGSPVPGLVKSGAGTLVLSSSDAASMNVTLEPVCRADLTATAIASVVGYGVPDGVVNSDDFFYYLTQYAAGNASVADLTASAIPGSPGYGAPDGMITNDDFFFYLSLYAAGC